MIRKIVFSATLALLTLNVSAVWGIKLIEMGVKTGLTSPKVEILSPTYGSYSLTTDNRVGFQVGVMSRINLLMFHIQPELLYSMNSYRLTTFSSSGELSKSTVKFNTVDVPVLFGLKLLMLRFQGGPVINILTESSVSKSEAPPRTVSFMKPAISYMFGLGADIGKINFDVRYNGQFARPEQTIQIGSQESKTYKTKLRTWMFSVGYMF